MREESDEIEPGEQHTEPNADVARRKRFVRNRPHRSEVRHTRISGAWAAVAVAVVLGVALIDFIAENTRSVRIDFFSANGHIPVAVALLAAAVSGAFVVLAVGVARTTQLRLAVRHKKHHEDAESAPDSDAS